MSSNRIVKLSYSVSLLMAAVLTINTMGVCQVIKSSMQTFIQNLLITVKMRRTSWEKIYKIITDFFG